MKILFLVPYPVGESPSQRFRFEQYFELLKSRGIDFTVSSFLDSHTWRVFFKPGKPVAKFFILIKGFLRRVVNVVQASRYDRIFIHRELAPIGPPLFEWIVARVLRKQIIYDFDDAIWMTDRQNESWLLRTVKWRGKVASICRMSYRVSCGNEYLCEFARKYSNAVVYNPTTIDTDFHKPVNVERTSAPVTIGWTGSHSTLKYLEEIETQLSTILHSHPEGRLAVIADVPPKFSSLPFKFIPWNSSSEIEDLSTFDIGIMPLPDDLWSKGKCGFKALQYLALEIPTVASPVGVNTSIIDNGTNGFLASDANAWLVSLERLLHDPSLRKAMGMKGRQKVVECYSVSSNTPNFLSLFD